MADQPRMTSRMPASSPVLVPRTWFMAAALAIVTLILYSPCFHYEFLNFDDDVYVTKNPHVLGGLSAANIRWAFELPGPGDLLHTANWHPLTWLSLQLDASLWGASAGAFHRTNVCLH